VATTTDISPYLQRPVRKLEDAMVEVEQQRLSTPAPEVALMIPSPKSGDAPPDDGVGKHGCHPGESRDP
jgi:hypothetical protein